MVAGRIQRLLKQGSTTVLQSEENLPHHVGFAHAATEVDHLPDHLPHGDGGGPWDEAHQPLEGLATDETVEKEGQDAWGGLQPHVQGDGGQADDELDGDDAAGSLEGQGALGGDSSFEFEVEAEGNNDEAATHMQVICNC